MKVYTRKGDDGTTGLFYGGRVRKDSALPSAYGVVDEAQAFLGLARVSVDRGSEVDTLLVDRCRELYVVMAELATLPANRNKLVDGESRVVPTMVDGLEAIIDDLSTRFAPPTEFVVPGESPVAAALDVARTVVRRAERATLADGVDSPVAVAYLNRLSDLLWTMARWHEGTSVLSRTDAAEGGTS